MDKSRFVYVTYIRTSPAQLWDAITNPELTKRWWSGTHQEAAWKPGSPWKLIFSDGRVADAGEVLEVDRPKHRVIKWRNEFSPELKADGYTRCGLAIQRPGETVKLTVMHEADHPHKLIGAFRRAGRASWRVSRVCSKPAPRCQRLTPRQEGDAGGGGYFADRELRIRR
jgi:uncharacterized protein YndB with AHSA1/START domain